MCVCQSVHRVEVHLVTTIHNVIGQSWSHGDPPATAPSSHHIGTPRPGPSDMFKLLHLDLTIHGSPSFTPAATRAVGLRLKGLLVLSYFDSITETLKQTRLICEYYVPRLVVRFIMTDQRDRRHHHLLSSDSVLDLLVLTSPKL